MQCRPTWRHLLDEKKWKVPCFIESLVRMLTAIRLLALAAALLDLDAVASNGFDERTMIRKSTLGS